MFDQINFIEKSESNEKLKLKSDLNSLFDQYNSEEDEDNKVKVKDIVIDDIDQEISILKKKVKESKSNKSKVLRKNKEVSRLTKRLAKVDKEYEKDRKSVV